MKRFTRWTVVKVVATGAVVTGAAAFAISLIPTVNACGGRTFQSLVNLFRTTPTGQPPTVDIQIPSPSQYSAVSEVTLPGTVSPGQEDGPSTSRANTREQDFQSAEEKLKNMASQPSTSWKDWFRRSPKVNDSDKPTEV